MSMSMLWDEFVGLTRDRLLTQKGDWKAIADEAKLTYRWLRTFARGEYRDVTADMVIRLARRLGMKFHIVVSEAGAAAKAVVPTPLPVLRKPIRGLRGGGKAARKGRGR